MVACLNKIHGIDERLSWILQIFSVNVFQKAPFNQLFTNYTTTDHQMSISKQLTFDDF